MSDGPPSDFGQPRGTYRESDSSPIPFAEAKEAWVPIARRALERVAGIYHGTITYQELAEEVQHVSGLRTTQLMWYWIGGLLEEVARRRPPNEPLLTALCVRADGTIGDGYARAVSLREQIEITDVELHAAQERLACYRHFGATLPPGGGVPAFTPQVAAKRARVRRPAEAPAPNLCPTCNVALPRSGVCDSCDA